MWKRVLACCVIASASSLHAEVWIVDAAGGGQFTDLPAAVAAAAPGDTLLMRNGRYQGAAIRRGLRLIALDASPLVELESALRIELLPANERVLVSGIGFRTCAIPLEIFHCAGSVEIENVRHSLFCAVFGASSSLGAPLRISDSPQVILRGCLFIGTRATSGSPYPAAEFSRSSVWMYESELMGAPGNYCAGQRGGLALRSWISNLFLSGSAISGGTGSSGGDCLQIPNPCSHGGGGDGIDGAGSHVRDFGSFIQGGFRGSWSYCSGPPNFYRDGRAWVSQPASYVRQAEALPKLVGKALLPMGALASVELELISANPQVVFLGFTRASFEFAGLDGTLWLDPQHAFPIGATSSAIGPATLSFVIVNDPLAYGFELHFQSVDVRGRFGASLSAILQ